MLHEDIINPLVSDFITRVTGQGLNYFNAQATTKLNDFVTYLSSIIPDRQFGFYPLRQDQNIGQGNVAFGIGNLASGAPMVFPGYPRWTESGMIVGPNIQPGGQFAPVYETVGIIDFSGKVENDFMFRRDASSIFYFLKHLRPGEYATSLYRGEGGLAPYFILDNSADWFQVIAPEFSTSRFRPQGTTYIYDEIFGEDKKGIQLDFSRPDSEKYYNPQALSFYDPDKGASAKRFYCINLNSKNPNYTLQTIFGRDPRLLSGTFPSPYLQIQKKDTFEYFFPRRMVIGAGASNLSNTKYNTEGLEHIVPGILITKGDYSNVAADIALNMATAVGILDFEGPQLVKDPLNDNVSNLSTANINSLNYYKTLPFIFNDYAREFANFTAKITSIKLDDLGRWFVELVSTLCGNQGCFGGWIARSPKELAEVRPAVNTGTYLTGNQVTGTYGNLRLGELQNNGIIGFVSGYMGVSGNFSGFAPYTISGHSGFYYTGSYNVFPPYKFFEVQKITGFVSGFLNQNGSFNLLENTSPYYNSGYFLSGKITDFTYSLIEQEPISGFQYGFLNRFTNSWSGFSSKDKIASSGYFANGEFKEFLPIRIIQKIPITGFRRGFMDGFGEFSGYTTGNFLSGILFNSDITSTDQNARIYYPTGGGFNGFDGLSGFDPDIGYEYSGFDFFDLSGFYGFDRNNPYFGEGEMTGFIGYKNVLFLSGQFSGAKSITGIDDGLGIIYDGFFNGNTYFSGIEFDVLTNQTLNYGTGYLIGNIGSKNVRNFYGDPGFDNRPGFDPLYGYRYTGFSFPEGSGFVGITGNQYGSGYMSGHIGSRNFVDFTGIYSGFSGLLDKYNKYLPNVIFPNFQFTRGSGFIAQNTIPGYGLLTGIISTGYLDGDAAFCTAAGSVQTYITGILSTGINISGVIGGQIDLSSGNISGSINSAIFTLAIISGGNFFETGYTGFNSGIDSGRYDIKSGAYISGNIGQPTYITGNLTIGSGQTFELSTGFISESGNIYASVDSIQLNIAIYQLLILQNGVSENGSLTSNIDLISYNDANVPTGLQTETGYVYSTIESINNYTSLINDVTGKFETGFYSISGLFRINTGAPAIATETVFYDISGILLSTGIQ